MTRRMPPGAQIAFCNSWLERQGIEAQTIDVEAYIDPSLSYEENIKLMKREFKLGGGRSRQKATRFLSADVADMVGDMATNDREEVRVVYLDNRNRVIGIESAHKGSLNACQCQPHEVFKTALLLNAAGLILVHNHPAGMPDPSDADIRNAERFREVGKKLGVEVRDSIIIGRGNFYSLQQEGHFQ